MAVGERYQESGKFTMGGAAVSAACAVVGGALAGFFYGIIDQVNPFIYINVLGALFVGFFAAMGATFGATMGKVRNGKVVTACALLGGVTCLYAAWVGWFYALTDWELFLGTSPNALWGLTQMVNAKGAWSIKGGTPTGGFLWFVWGVEALMILGIATVGGFGGLEDSPFCEPCGVWADDEKQVVLETPEDIEGLSTAMSSGDFSGLAALAPGNDQGATWVEAKVESCPRQGAPYYLTVTGKVRTKDDKGEESIQDFSLVKLIEVDKATADIVRSPAPAAGPGSGGDVEGEGEKAKDSDAGGTEVPG